MRRENDYSSSRENFSGVSLWKAVRTFNLILISSSFLDPKVFFARMDSNLSRCQEKDGDSIGGEQNVPFHLFGDILVRLCRDFLHDVDVTFSVTAESGRFFKKGGTNIGGGVNELLSELIQGWKTASQIVQATSNGALSTAFFVQEIDDRLFAPATSVGNGVLLIFFALSEEFDGGEGLDAIHRGNGFVVARVRIHIGENTVLLVLEITRDLLEDRFQRLAVSAPRSGESDESVLGFVQGNGVEIVDGEGLDFGWGRRFNVRLGTTLFGDTVRELIQTRVDDRGNSLFDQVLQFATAFIVFDEFAISPEPFEGYSDK